MSELIIVSSLGNESKDFNVHKIVAGNADVAQEIIAIATSKYPAAPIISSDGLLADFANHESEYVLQQNEKGLNVYKKAVKTTSGWFTNATEVEFELCECFRSQVIDSSVVCADVLNRQRAEIEAKVNDCLNCSSESLAKEKLRKQNRELNEELSMTRIKIDNYDLEIAELQNKFAMRTDECKKLYNEINNIRTINAQEAAELQRKIAEQNKEITILREEAMYARAAGNKTKTTTVTTNPVYSQAVDLIKSFDRNTLRKVTIVHSETPDNSPVMPRWITLKPARD